MVRKHVYKVFVFPGLPAQTHCIYGSETFDVIRQMLLVILEESHRWISSGRLEISVLALILLREYPKVRIWVQVGVGEVIRNPRMGVGE